MSRLPKRSTVADVAGRDQHGGVRLLDDGRAGHAARRRRGSRARTPAPRPGRPSSQIRRVAGRRRRRGAGGRPRASGTRGRAAAELDAEVHDLDRRLADRRGRRRARARGGRPSSSAAPPSAASQLRLDGHLDLVGLADVAHVRAGRNVARSTPARCSREPRAELGLERALLASERGQVERVEAAVHRPHRVVQDVGGDGAEGAERPGRARHEDGGDADLAGEQAPDQRPGAAEGDQREVARVDAGAREDLGERGVHVRHGDAHRRSPPPRAGSCRAGPRSAATASSASARSSRIRPPRKRSGSRKPQTRKASESVASLPPRP